MAEPFKNLLNPALVELTGELLEHSGRSRGKRQSTFDRRAFNKLALEGLEQLELKARAMRIADGLEAALPEDFEAACALIEGALAPPHPGEDLGQIQMGSAGLCGWIVWPLGEFVVRRGMHAPERALACLHALTQRFSAEFAVRPFLVEHPKLAFRRLLAWTRDPSLHVRRLASEGSRPRLPWGLRLQALVQDPSPTEAILEALFEDPSAYLRRSVANHWNDIAKDHPERVVAWVERRLPDADKTGRALLKHASRTLIKAGHPAMLAAWGHGRGFVGDVQLSLERKRLKVGESLGFQVELCSRSKRSQALVVDFKVHYQKANGSLSPKVFKGWKLELEAGANVRLQKQLSFRPVTTRRLYPGPHALDLCINGRACALQKFRLDP